MKFSSNGCVSAISYNLVTDDCDSNKFEFLCEYGKLKHNKIKYKSSCIKKKIKKGETNELTSSEYDYENDKNSQGNIVPSKIFIFKKGSSQK